jgi:DNA-binding NarL/FixJ family response regulator
MLAQSKPQSVADRARDAVLVIHEHDMIRRSVINLIAPNWTDMRVIACPSLERAHDPTFGQAAEPCDREDIALVLLIASLGDHGASDDIIRVVDAFRGIPVVLLSAVHDQDAALDAIRQGARGYLSGLMTVNQMIEALRLVCAGGVYVGPMPACVPGSAHAAAAGAPETGAHPPAARRPAFDPGILTPRETEVFRHLREGKPNKIIAYELGMSENTVKVHVGRIFKKLGATNRTVIACHQEDDAPLAPTAVGEQPPARPLPPEIGTGRDPEESPSKTASRSP